MKFKNTTTLLARGDVTRSISVLVEQYLLSEYEAVKYVRESTIVRRVSANLNPDKNDVKYLSVRIRKSILIKVHSE